MMAKFSATVVWDSPACALRDSPCNRDEGDEEWAEVGVDGVEKEEEEEKMVDVGVEEDNGVEEGDDEPDEEEETEEETETLLFLLVEVSLLLVLFLFPIGFDGEVCQRRPSNRVLKISLR